MSKRREAYKRGWEMLRERVEAWLKSGTAPSREDMQNERRAITELRGIAFEIDDAVWRAEPSEAFFVLLSEEYKRYDDVLPERIQLTFLPAEHDDPKRIHQHILQSELKPDTQAFPRRRT